MFGSVGRRVQRLLGRSPTAPRPPRFARSGDRAGTVQARLEVFFVALRDGRADLRLQDAIAPARGDPDRRVLELARREARGDREPFVHSTSWRSEHGVLVLTYLVIADALRSPDAERVDFWELGRHARLPIGTDRGLVRLDVLWHGLRHIALLARESPDAHARRLPSGALEALSALAPAAAGKLDSLAREG
jgi:hypothetical protein